MNGDQNDTERIEHLSISIKQVRSEIGKVIIGQHKIIDQLLISLFAKGHCLLIGVPGLAKTLLIR
ncbi:MAG: AAA family ATPase, partial [Bacteroidota bacterium]